MTERVKPIKIEVEHVRHNAVVLEPLVKLDLPETVREMQKEDRDTEDSPVVTMTEADTVEFDMVDRVADVMRGIRNRTGR